MREKEVLASAFPSLHPVCSFTFSQFVLVGAVGVSIQCCGEYGVGFAEARVREPVRLR